MRNQRLIAERFSGRKEYDVKSLYEQHWSELGLRESEVVRALEYIGLVTGIPVGLLRPEDEIARLLDPVKASTPWEWLHYQFRAGDAEAALLQGLRRQLKKSGTINEWPMITTLDEYVRAWCGERREMKSV